MERIVRHPSFFLGQDMTEGCLLPWVFVVATPAGRTLETLRFPTREEAVTRMQSADREGQWIVVED